MGDPREKKRSSDTIPLDLFTSSFYLSVCTNLCICVCVCVCVHAILIAVFFFCKFLYLLHFYLDCTCTAFLSVCSSSFFTFSFFSVFLSSLYLTLFYLSTITFFNKSKQQKFKIVALLMVFESTPSGVSSEFQNLFSFYFYHNSKKAKGKNISIIFERRWKENEWYDGVEKIDAKKGTPWCAKHSNLYNNQRGAFLCTK